MNVYLLLLLCAGCLCFLVFSCLNSFDVLILFLLKYVFCFICMCDRYACMMIESVDIKKCVIQYKYTLNVS